MGGFNGFRTNPKIKKALDPHKRFKAYSHQYECSVFEYGLSVQTNGKMALNENANLLSQ